jgi:hypothetical protein
MTSNEETPMEVPLPRPKKEILVSLKRTINNFMYGAVFTIIEMNRITDMEVHLYDLEDIVAIRSKYTEVIGKEALHKIIIYRDLYNDKVCAEHAHCLYKKDLNKIVDAHMRSLNKSKCCFIF